jgi:hypothetical protein
MKSQTYANHSRFFAPFHFVLLPALLLGVIGASVNLNRSIGDPQRLYSASLILLLMLSVLAMSLFARVFALKAQDRAIRAEENLRHYVLAGALIDPRVTTRQIVGLRFAPDDEFVALTTKAAETGMSETDIKKAIKHWRADWYRA